MQRCTHLLLLLCGGRCIWATEVASDAILHTLHADLSGLEAELVRPQWLELERENEPCSNSWAVCAGPDDIASCAPSTALESGAVEDEDLHDSSTRLGALMSVTKNQNSPPWMCKSFCTKFDTREWGDFIKASKNKPCMADSNAQPSPDGDSFYCCTRLLHDSTPISSPKPTFAAGAAAPCPKKDQQQQQQQIPDVQQLVLGPTCDVDVDMMKVIDDMKVRGEIKIPPAYSASAEFICTSDGKTEASINVQDSAKGTEQNFKHAYSKDEIQPLRMSS